MEHIADNQPLAGNPSLTDSDAITPHAPGEFRTLMERQIQLVDEDNEDNEPISTEGSGGPVLLTTLFNFEDPYWCNLYAQMAKPSYNEELALYELLELDADGEDDIELDGSTQDILSS